MLNGALTTTFTHYVYSEVLCLDVVHILTCWILPRTIFSIPYHMQQMNNKGQNSHFEVTPHMWWIYFLWHFAEKWSCYVRAWLYYVWAINHSLWLGHETLVCTVSCCVLLLCLCLYIAPQMPLFHFMCHIECEFLLCYKQLHLLPLLVPSELTIKVSLVMAQSYRGSSHYIYWLCLFWSLVFCSNMI